MSYARIAGIVPLLLLCAALMLLVAACEAGDLAPGPGEPEPTPEVTPERADLTIEGDVVVLANTVGDDPDAMTYHTVVVFTVTNLDPERAAVNVPFTVLLTSDGEPLEEASASGNVTVAPGATRIVVFQPADLPQGREPDDAEIQIEPEEDLVVEPDELAAETVTDQADWSVVKEELTCEEIAGGCELLGQLTWTGDTPVSNIRVHAVLRDPAGEIVAAGAGEPGVEGIEPGESIPFAVMVHGLEQTEPGGPITSPGEGEVEAEFYVEVVTLDDD